MKKFFIAIIILVVLCIPIVLSLTLSSVKIELSLKDKIEMVDETATIKLKVQDEVNLLDYIKFDKEIFIEPISKWLPFLYSGYENNNLKNKLSIYATNYYVLDENSLNSFIIKPLQRGDSEVYIKIKGEKEETKINVMVVEGISGFNDIKTDEDFRLLKLGRTYKIDFGLLMEDIVAAGDYIDCEFLNDANQVISYYLDDDGYYISTIGVGSGKLRFISRSDNDIYKEIDFNINFNSEDVEKAIKEYLQITDNRTISNDNLLDIRSLNLEIEEQYPNLALKDISVLLNLNELSIKSNQKNELDIDLLDNELIDKLSIENLIIKNFEISKFKELKLIDVYILDISDSLLNLNGLLTTSLEIYGNDLGFDEIQISEFKELINLVIESDSITKLTLDNLPKIGESIGSVKGSLLLNLSQLEEFKLVKISNINQNKIDIHSLLADLPNVSKILFIDINELTTLDLTNELIIDNKIKDILIEASGSDTFNKFENLKLKQHFSYENIVLKKLNYNGYDTKIFTLGGIDNLDEILEIDSLTLENTNLLQNKEVDILEKLFPKVKKLTLKSISFFPKDGEMLNKLVINKSDFEELVIEYCNIESLEIYGSDDRENATTIRLINFGLISLVLSNLTISLLELEQLADIATISLDGLGFLNMEDLSGIDNNDLNKNGYYGLVLNNLSSLKTVNLRFPKDDQKNTISWLNRLEITNCNLLESVYIDGSIYHNDEVTKDISFSGGIRIVDCDALTSLTFKNFKAKKIIIPDNNYEYIELNNVSYLEDNNTLIDLYNEESIITVIDNQENKKLLKNSTNTSIKEIYLNSLDFDIIYLNNKNIEKIKLSNLKNIKELNLSNNSIISLSDLIIQNVTIDNGVVIDLSNNAITEIKNIDFEFSNIHTAIINELKLNNNYITTIDNNILYRTNSLDLASNNLTELVLKRETKLTYLNLANNENLSFEKDGEFEISYVNELLELVLDNTKISKFDNKNLPNLHKLSLKHNTNLKEMNLSSEDNIVFQDVDLTGTKLTNLVVKNIIITNPLIGFSAENLVRLMIDSSNILGNTIDLKDNVLKELIIKNTNISVLNLSNSVYLDELINNIEFDNNSRLSDIVLEDNNINDLSDIINNLLDDLTLVKKLYLNNTSHINLDLSNYINLEEVYLNNATVKSLVIDQNESKIRKLDLTNAIINNIKLANLLNLESLEFDTSKVSAVDIRNVKTVSDLNLVFNGINEEYFDSEDSKFKLVLHDLSINKLEIINNSKAVTDKLFTSALNYYQFNNLNVNELILSNNNIEEHLNYLDKETGQLSNLYLFLSSFKSITKLDLKDNTVYSYTLSSNKSGMPNIPTSLKSIDLSNNPLKTIYIDVIDGLFTDLELIKIGSVEQIEDLDLYLNSFGNLELLDNTSITFNNFVVENSSININPYKGYIKNLQLKNVELLNLENDVFELNNSIINKVEIINSINIKNIQLLNNANLEKVNLDEPNLLSLFIKDNKINSILANNLDNLQSLTYHNEEFNLDLSSFRNLKKLDLINIDLEAANNIMSMDKLEDLVLHTNDELELSLNEFYDLINLVLIGKFKSLEIHNSEKLETINIDELKLEKIKLTNIVNLNSINKINTNNLYYIFFDNVKSNDPIDIKFDTLNSSNFGLSTDKKFLLSIKNVTSIGTIQIANAINDYEFIDFINPANNHYVIENVVAEGIVFTNNDISDSHISNLNNYLALFDSISNLDLSVNKINKISNLDIVGLKSINLTKNPLHSILFDNTESNYDLLKDIYFGSYRISDSYTKVKIDLININDLNFNVLEDSIHNISEFNVIGNEKRPTIKLDGIIKSVGKLNLNNVNVPLIDDKLSIISSNQIEEVNLDNISGIKVLEIKNSNNFRKINLNELELETIDLQDNRIIDINLANLSNLNTLNLLQNNNIEYNLAFLEFLPSLRSLKLNNIYENDLEKINNAKSIQELIIHTTSYNFKLMDLPLLKKLDITGENIEDLELIDLESLEELYFLSTIKIKDLHLRNMPNLDIIVGNTSEIVQTITYDNIKTIYYPYGEKEVPKHIKLFELNKTNFDLSSLENALSNLIIDDLTIRNALGVKVKETEYLNLIVENFVIESSSIEIEYDGFDDGIKVNNINLINVNTSNLIINNSELKTIKFIGSNVFEKVDLTNNKLENFVIEAIDEDVSKFKEINVSNNKLIELDLSLLNDLAKINASNNELVSVFLPERIEYIDLTSNKIIEFKLNNNELNKIVNNGYLRGLNISNNQLQEVHISYDEAITRLVDLDLSGNEKVSRIYLSNLTKLENILLSGLYGLNDIYIDNADVKELSIPQNAYIRIELKNLSGLNNVVLYDNQLEAMSIDVLVLKNIGKLNKKSIDNLLNKSKTVELSQLGIGIEEGYEKDQFINFKVLDSKSLEKFILEDSFNIVKNITFENNTNLSYVSILNTSIKEVNFYNNGFINLNIVSDANAIDDIVPGTSLVNIHTLISSLSINNNVGLKSISVAENVAFMQCSNLSLVNTNLGFFTNYDFFNSFTNVVDLNLEKNNLKIYDYLNQLSKIEKLNISINPNFNTGTVEGIYQSLHSIIYLNADNPKLKLKGLHIKSESGNDVYELNSNAKELLYQILLSLKGYIEDLSLMHNNLRYDDYQLSEINSSNFRFLKTMDLRYTEITDELAPDILKEWKQKGNSEVNVVTFAASMNLDIHILNEKDIYYPNDQVGFKYMLEDGTEFIPDNFEIVEGLEYVYSIGNGLIIVKVNDSSLINPNAQIKFRAYKNFTLVDGKVITRYTDYITLRLNEGYYIYNETHLRGIQSALSSTYNIYLQSNITLTSALPYSNFDFPGIFEGNNYTITYPNITIGVASDSVEALGGLFRTNSGDIKNLILNKVSIQYVYTASRTKNINLGAVVGINNGTISNVTVKDAKVMYPTTPGSIIHDGAWWIYAGGVAGRNNSTIENVSVTISNQASDEANIGIHRNYSSTGGISGINYGSIRYSNNYAVIYGNGDIGGIVGTNYEKNALITNSNNYGSISYYLMHNARSIGGIIGYNYYGKVNSSTNEGLVSYVSPASDSRSLAPKMGGVIGHNYKGEYTNVKSTKNVAKGSLKVIKWTTGVLWWKEEHRHDQAKNVGNIVGFNE